jgi:hypothetical protein
MTYDIHNQTPDQWNDVPRQRPEIEAQLAKAAAIAFVQDCPEFFCCENNWERILGLLRRDKVPISRRNLGLAYEALKDTGLFETGEGPELHYRTVKLSPEDAGVKKVYAEPKKNFDHEGLAETELLRENRSRREELGAGEVIANRLAADAANRTLAGEPGQPVSKEMKQKYKQSLGRTKTTFEDGKPARWSEARMEIRESRPDLNPESQTFNLEVHALLNRWSRGEE